MATTNRNNTKHTKQATPTIVGANDIGKLPPQAPELEASVLGGIMIEKDAYREVSDLLTPGVFYTEQHRVIYEAIRELAGQDKPIDVLTVSEKLKNNGTLDKAGGIVYLAELTRRVASTVHLRYHAQIVAQKSTARDMIALAAKIVEKGYDETKDVEEMIQEAQADIFAIASRTQKHDFTQIDPVIEEAFKRMEKAARNDGTISGIPSGFHALDKVTSGWQSPDLIIIAARPAMGKTAFVLSMARNMAIDRHIPVAIFSLEMSNVQLINRLIMNVCEIEGDKIKSGRLSAVESKKLNTKINIMKGAPLYLDETPSLSLFELQNKARKLHDMYGIKMIIIDYLQLMNAQGAYFGSREQEVAIISRGLKALAKELDIPIIALSQLNRRLEGREGIDGKTPQLSDLRESGAIEQDADMVCFIHRPEYYHIYTDDKGNNMQNVAQIVIAKHRNGATTTVNLKFRSKYARFMNMNESIEGDDEKDTPDTQEDGKTMTISSSMNSAMGAVSEGQLLSPHGGTVINTNSLGESLDEI